MTDKLGAAMERYRALESELALPGLYREPDKMARLLREQKELAPIARAVDAIEAARRRAGEAAELLSHPELGELAQEEQNAARADIERLTAQLQELLLPRDPADEKNVILEIRGGTGGEEAALFASALCRMYTMYAERMRWKTEYLAQNITELGGVKEAIMLISGKGAYSRLKYEGGVHRVQRVPETESSGRVHTSAATVAVLPEAEDVDVELDMGELLIETCRSSGAGGQHVNKTESAVRVVHKPTGMVVECQDERSQHKNKERALKILRSRLLEKARTESVAERAGQRRSMVGSGDRSERVRTYNFPQGRLTDHRVNLTLYRLDTVMDGALDEIIAALASADSAQRLADAH
ncbi:MAG: peptide chain release factor 1 [Oscillospiraceae bacterium]|jgi:peptide chain release factor 1|nr:peptide chain release factor 1 [Oscillospiraceae bacterium]